ncbi:MAG: 3-methyl-2-oxobutanoate hydroxymethyltransferase [Candidatus Omnitrophota bacterium]
MPKMTIAELVQLKGKRKVTMLTAYDYPFAAALDKAGIDMILVGDSVANVVLGLDSTKEMTMSQMLYHAKAVRRAVKNALLIGDMPYVSYQQDSSDRVKNARLFVEDAGCDAVKLEWFDKAVVTAESIVKAGIPVMGHIGLTPQTADELGGFKVQGKDAQAAKKLIEQACRLEDIGCFSILLECVPDKVTQIITQKLKIPTIGIGAGPYCDGQVLVTHDLLGLFDRYSPKFVKRYADLKQNMITAFEQYKRDVEEGRFPTQEHSYKITSQELEKLLDEGV